MKIFRLSKEYNVVCNFKKTKYGFKHTATLCKNGNEVAKTKCCYYNRTWESFEYESVLHKVIKNYFEERQAKRYIKKLNPPENEHFKSVKMGCAFGELICDKIKDKNTFKKRMIKTLPGINFPDNWDDLPEKEKAKRLNNVTKELGK